MEFVVAARQNGENPVPRSEHSKDPVASFEQNQTIMGSMHEKRGGRNFRADVGDVGHGFEHLVTLADGIEMK